MRDKIIAIVTLTSIFSLFLYYKVSSVGSEQISYNNKPINQDEIIINVVDDYENDDDSDVVLDALLDSNLDANECSLTTEQTDVFSFSEAFQYYRSCLGKGEIFSWNSNKYKTLLSNEVVIEKNRPSSFYATRLESYLRAQKIKTLVICGVTTNICVESTARDAAQKDYKTYVVKDSIAEIDEFRHEVAIKAMQHMFAKIVTVEEVVYSWGRS